MADQPATPAKRGGKKLDWKHPGALEYGIVIVGVIGLVLAYNLWKGRTAKPAASGGGGQAARPILVQSPTGMSRGALWHWNRDHNSSPPPAHKRDRDFNKAPLMPPSPAFGVPPGSEAGR